MTLTGDARASLTLRRQPVTHGGNPLGASLSRMGEDRAGSLMTNDK
ncbi:MAG: hypothetical protein V7L20_30220 [Nostoc sp.]